MEILLNSRATRALINKFPKLIDVRNQDGFTPLHLAVLSKDCQNAKILINEVSHFMLLSYIH